MSKRAALRTLLVDDPRLAAAGLPAGEIFQADTLDSPKGRPFVVIRWLEELSRVGRTSVQPIECWIYDERGDYTRADAIGNAIREVLSDAIAIVYEGGCLTQFRTRGPGIGRGRDMFDAGWDAVVIPYYFQVVNSDA